MRFSSSRLVLPRAAFARRRVSKTPTRNHNNKINRQEFLERETDVFFLINSNKDGHLSIVEIKNVDVARFHAADVNGDGVLSMEEFLEARNLDFDAADTNKDGGLTRQEVEGFH